MASMAAIIARRKASLERQKSGDKNVEIVYGQPIDLPLIDEEENLKHALKCYDTLYWTLSEKGSFPSNEFHSTMRVSRLVYKPWTGKGRIPRDEILTTGCMKWCVSHAFAEHSHVLGKLNASMFGYILVSTLLLLVNGITYIVPPDFSTETLSDIFMVLIGTALFLQIFNVIGYIAIGSLINDSYTPAMSMLARVEADFYLSCLSITVYTAIACMIGAMFCVAYDGNVTVLYVLAPIVVVIFSFFGYLLYDTRAKSYELKKEAVYQFYEAYCEPDGRLTEKYLNMAYDSHDKLFVESEGALGNDEAADKNAL